MAIQQPNTRRQMNDCGGDAGNSKGIGRTSEYKAWANMKSRCLTATTPGFKNYGGRGIRVCARWKDSYPAFLEDMGRKPSSDYSLDRIDVNGDYEPSNCQWANLKQQSRNKRTTIRVDLNGETKPFVEWLEASELNRMTVEMRVKAGWSRADALTVPTMKPNESRAVPFRECHCPKCQPRAVETVEVKPLRSHSISPAR